MFINLFGKSKNYYKTALIATYAVTEEITDLLITARAFQNFIESDIKDVI